jgi:SseB protein N-terminal domain
MTKRIKQRKRSVRMTTTRRPGEAISAAQLEHLMRRAMADLREEEPFFRALLDATVYAHIPLSDDSGRLRFIQFIRPDNGATVLPFFTDEAKAHAAAQGAVQTIALSARKLLWITQGATLMLNPNDAHCVLYPEEIDTLLRTGKVAAIQQTTSTSEMAIRAPLSVPDDVHRFLVDTLRPLTYVSKAYVLEAYSTANPTTSNLLIVLDAAKGNAERAIRATLTHFRAHHVEVGGPVDVTTCDRMSDEPDWAAKSGFAPIFDRALLSVAEGPDPSVENGGRTLHAASDPEPGAQFNERFLDTLVLVPVDPAWKQGNVIPAGVEIGVQVWKHSDGSDFTPFFSSASHVYVAVPEGLNCAQMTTREMFMSLPTMNFCLNPGSDTPTFFSAESVQDLLIRYARRVS